MNHRAGPASATHCTFVHCTHCTQESNRGLLHCWQIPYQLSYQRSPIVLSDVIKDVLQQMEVAMGGEMSVLSILLGLPYRDEKAKKHSCKTKFPYQFSSGAQSCLTLWLHGLQHARPPCPSPTPRVYPNSCALSRWCHPTISSSVIPFSSCLQSFPASGSFQMSQLFTSGFQSIRVSASSVVPMSIQDWFPLGWTGSIFVWSKGISRVFSNTTVQKHQFFGVQLSL